MRLPSGKLCEELDFAIIGIPFDTAASFRASLIRQALEDVVEVLPMPQ